MKKLIFYGNSMFFKYYTFFKVGHDISLKAINSLSVFFVFIGKKHNYHLLIITRPLKVIKRIIL